MAEITVLTLSHRWLFPKDYITQGKEGYWFFFFFYDSDILKNKSSKLAGSLLFDVAEFLLVTWPLTHFLMLILKTQTNLFSFFFSFILFQINLGSQGLIRRPGQEVVSYLGAGVRTIIWGALGDESQKKGNWATQMSDVCILTPEHLSGFLCHR